MASGGCAEALSGLDEPASGQLMTFAAASTSTISPTTIRYAANAVKLNRWNTIIPLTPAKLPCTCCGDAPYTRTGTFENVCNGIAVNITLSKLHLIIGNI